MPSFTVTQYVAASSERVFALATDFERVQEILPAIQRIELLTDGPLGAGTRFRQTREVLGREQTQELEVLEHEPPHLYTVGTESHGFRIESRFRFHRRAEGTEIELTIEGEAQTLTAMVAGKLLGPTLEKLEQECAADLAALAAAAEREEET